MKTPMQELIERFETGRQHHEERMNEKGLSPTEKNRASYLFHHCDSVISIASELMKKEKQIIIDAYEVQKFGLYAMTDTGIQDTAIKSGEQYYKETFNK